MSDASIAVDALRCSVCVLKSSLQERDRQTEALQAQAELSAQIAERHAATVYGEAHQVAMSITEEIRQKFGEGGI